MSPPEVIEDIFRDAFEDVALLIGGVATIYHIRDDLVWTLFRRLDRVRSRALARLSCDGYRDLGALAPGRPQRSHAAVEQFLQQNRAPVPR
jgi:hypothetical protein